MIKHDFRTCLLYISQGSLFSIIIMAVRPNSFNKMCAKKLIIKYSSIKSGAYPVILWTSFMGNVVLFVHSLPKLLANVRTPMNNCSHPLGYKPCLLSQPSDGPDINE